MAMLFRPRAIGILLEHSGALAGFSTKLLSGFQNGKEDFLKQVLPDQGRGDGQARERRHLRETR